MRPPLCDVRLRDYRCFGAEQRASLAPLSLLVGENSVGKTSFLAAIRAVCRVAYGPGDAGFNEPPYQLGSFSDMAHWTGGRTVAATSFDIGFTDWNGQTPIEITLTFSRPQGGDAPTIVRWEHDGGWIVQNFTDGRPVRVDFGTGKRHWTIHKLPFWSAGRVFGPQLLHAIEIEAGRKVANRLNGLVTHFDPVRHLPPYAGAPIRANPDRTYDPRGTPSDPWGASAPAVLGETLAARPDHQRKIEAFGAASGLFDEIEVRRLGRSDSAPFQVLVRKFGARTKGPKRNLVDVGFGVSQILPVLTELYREKSPYLFLLQQPEVHLHPSAQAELGTLFCEVAASGRQIVVETHSDHLMDRVRMDVRDGRTGLKPEDVSVLFFERESHAVRIHSLRFDRNGNVLNAPPGYRQFFMDETRRSVGL